jgi:beta-galactosidase
VNQYRYREPLFGAELYHYSLVGTDGVTPTTGGEQYSQAAREMALLRKQLKPNTKEPAAYAARRTALLYNVENRWDIDNHKQTIRWDTMGHILKYYRALKSLGCPVDVITEDRDFTQYPFLVAPAYQLIDTNLVRRGTDYVQNGGHLVLTCRTGQKDRRGHLWEAPCAAPIHDLIGARVSYYDTLPSPVVGKVRAGKRVYDWASWGEVLELREGTSALAHYADQFYAGDFAAVAHKLGRGIVTYIGVDSQDGALEADLVRGVFNRAGVGVEDFDDGFVVDWRDGFWVATNFTEKTQRVPISRGAKLLIGLPNVPPAGVTVWQE